MLENDGRVRIVFMTNGDGYVEGVRLAVHRPVTSPEDFVRYGVRRRTEALEAACDLGMDRRDILCLWFPDDGLDRLWTSHWTSRHPYVSPHALYSHVPYATSLTHAAKYDGFDLDMEIELVIKNFRLDWVILPDPRDRHPDHAATGRFVLDALRRRDQTGQQLSFRNIKVLSYLVHYGDYPSSNAWARQISGSGVNGTPYASRILSGTQWLDLPLTPEEQAEKRRALADYESQLLVLGTFLKQFMRADEQFGRLDAAQILAIPQEYTHTPR